MALYTLGQWTVQEGREEEFIEAWEEFASWTEDVIEGVAWAKLLRDAEDGRRFISFGPWRDESAVAGWRGHPGFQERVGRIQELLEDFTPHTMETAAEVGPSTPDP